MRISWWAAGPRSEVDGARGTGPRRATRARPGCESLDGRQLLSGAAASLPVGPLVPPAAEVADAVSALESKAGQDFQKLTADLTHAQQSSRVTPGQFSALQGDAAAIDGAITAAGLDSATTQADLDKVQNVLDDAFLAATFRRAGWVRTQASLDEATAGAHVAPVLIRATVAEMKGVARAAGVAGPEHAAIEADKQAVASDLGSDPDTDLGGATPRDPLMVYDDGQVGGFVRPS